MPSPDRNGPAPAIHALKRPRNFARRMRLGRLARALPSGGAEAKFGVRTTNRKPPAILSFLSLRRMDATIARTASPPRWVQRYAPELNKRCRRELKPTNGSWRVDETYICQGNSRIDTLGHQCRTLVGLADRIFCDTPFDHVNGLPILLAAGYSWQPSRCVPAPPALGKSDRHLHRQIPKAYAAYESNPLRSNGPS